MNGADDAEIAEAITPDVKADLSAALNGAAIEMSPASVGEIVTAVGRVVSIIGPDWTREARAEFVAIVTDNLSSMPGGLTLDALSRAERRVTRAANLLSWVCEDVEPRAGKLEAELKMLTRLSDLAG